MLKILKPSDCGELEIADLNKIHLQKEMLSVEILGRRSTAWLNTGTHDSILQDSNFVQTVEALQELKISWAEENYLSDVFYQR